MSEEAISLVQDLDDRQRAAFLQWLEVNPGWWCDTCERGQRCTSRLDASVSYFVHRRDPEHLRIARELNP